MARSYRAYTWHALNNLREQQGEKVDLISAQKALDDYDQVIAGAATIPSTRVTAAYTEYYAGQVAFQMKSETLAYSYWNKCAQLNHSGCLYNLADAHLTGNGGEKVDFQQSLDLYHKIFDSGLNAQCWGSYSALRIAKLSYFLDVHRSPDDDPLTWVQKSYDRSAQVAARAQQKTACAVEEAQVEEFLYRLDRGVHNNDLLGPATNDENQRVSISVAAKYLAGTIDEKAFESAVEASHSDRDRCYAYFEAMWFAEATKNHSAARTYYDRMSENANERCRAEIVFARKFGFQN